jgi:hypothetical protein
VRIGDKSDDAPLFVNRRGRPFTGSAIRLLFDRLKVRTGIADLCAHMLRYTWATNYNRSPTRNTRQRSGLREISEAGSRPSRQNRGMRTLLSEQYAPITSSIGFLRLDLDKAVGALMAWRTALGRDPRKEERPEGFPECLLALEPLVGGGDPRELFVETNGPWTAYFDCGLNGTDPVPPTSFLASAAGCDGLAVMATPHITHDGAIRRYGGVQFQLFGPHQTHFINYVRTISVANDDGWRFDVSGEPQPFEDQTAYTRTRVRDRFTSQMLADYCLALGIDVFNAAAYGPRAVLVRSLVKLPTEPLFMSLRDAQVRLGIVPGEADALPG